MQYISSYKWLINYPDTHTTCLVSARPLPPLWDCCLWPSTDTLVREDNVEDLFSIFIYILSIVRIMQKGCKPKLIVKLYLELEFNMQLQNLWGHATFLLPFRTKLLTWREDHLWPCWKWQFGSWLCCQMSSCPSHQWVCHSCTSTHWATGHLQQHKL